jgi:hypothetical protein
MLAVIQNKQQLPMSHDSHQLPPRWHVTVLREPERGQDGHAHLGWL